MREGEGRGRERRGREGGRVREGERAHLMSEDTGESEAD